LLCACGFLALACGSATTPGGEDNSQDVAQGEDATDADVPGADVDDAIAGDATPTTDMADDAGKDIANDGVKVDVPDVAADGDIAEPDVQVDAGCDPLPISLAAGSLIVNELMIHPKAVNDTVGEWVELYNTTASPIPLTGLYLSTGDGWSHTVYACGLIVAPGGVATLCRDADSAKNGGVTCDYTYGDELKLANAAGSLTLRNAVSIGATVQDIAMWDASVLPVDGKSWSLDPGHADATNNDNSDFWCSGTTPYGSGDLGTPHAANADCPKPVDTDSDGLVDGQGQLPNGRQCRPRRR
jgi:hypothetical protein